MADNIGSLTAVVRATAGQFAQDMKQIEASLDELKSHANGLNLKEAFSFGAGVEAMRAAFDMAREAVGGFFEIVEQGAKLKVLSDALGVTTQELSGLRFAAAESEVAADSLDNRLQKMLKTIGEMHAGNKEAGGALAALGLTSAELKGSAAEDFEKIADAIAKLKNPADEAAAAVKIFGKAGADLLPLLNKGTEGIEKARRKLRELGGEIDDNSAQSMKDLKDSLHELETAWIAFETTLATEVAPILKVIADELKGMAVSSTQHAHGITAAVIAWTKFAAEIGAVIIIVPAVVEAIGFIVEGIQAMVEAETILEALTNPAALAAGIAAAAVAVTVISSKFDELKTKVAAAQEAAEKHAKSLGKIKDSTVEVNTEAEKNIKHLEALMKKGAEVAKGVREPWEKFRDTLSELRGLMAEGAIGMDTFHRAAAKAAAELEKVLVTQNKIADFRESPGTAAALVGTTEGFSAVEGSKRLADDLNRHKADLQAEQLAEEKQHTEFLRQIATAVTGQTTAPDNTTNVADF